MGWLTDNCELVRAEDVREGDRVCFDVPRLRYLVEVVEVSPIGMVRHRYHDDTASTSYWPGETLFIQRASAEVPYAHGQ